jgi:glycosyltransferase involved in cell wall biosynthesis
MGEGAPDILASHPVSGWLSAMATTTSMLATGLRMPPGADLLVAHWLVPCGLVALAMGRKLGIPVHLYAHGGDVALLESLPLGKVLARRLDGGATGITFVSEDLRRRFLTLLGRPPRARTSVIPMGIHRPAQDDAYGLELRQQVGDRKVLLTVGRMTAIKGLGVLAEALEGIENLVWLAAGEGPIRREITEACLVRGISLVCLGAVNESQRESALAMADVFVLPSIELGHRREGAPTALLEAVAAGVPAVASNTGGVKVLGDEAGVRLVEPGSPSALSAALKQVLRDGELRQHMAAEHQRAGAEYCWEHRGAQHDEQLYASTGFSRSA